jgi:hypothetical protein
MEPDLIKELMKKSGKSIELSLITQKNNSLTQKKCVASQSISQHKNVTL